MKLKYLNENKFKIKTIKIHTLLCSSKQSKKVNNFIRIQLHISIRQTII